jgi:flagellar biosynthetic protein FliR
MTISEPEVGALLAAWARTAALAATAPVIGDAGLSARARLVVVVAVGAVVGGGRPGVLYGALPAVLPIELLVGLATGLVARLVLAAAATAGQLAGLSLGLGFASQYDVRAGESASTLASLVSVVAGLAFLAVGGLESVVRAAAVPVDAAALGALGPALLREGAAALSRGLALAAPIVLASLIGNLGLAVMNRAAPAINVFSIALAAILLLGGLLLHATAPSLVGGIAALARTAASALAGG